MLSFSNPDLERLGRALVALAGSSDSIAQSFRSRVYARLPDYFVWPDSRKPPSLLLAEVIGEYLSGNAAVARSTRP